MIQVSGFLRYFASSLVLFHICACRSYLLLTRKSIVFIFIKKAGNYYVFKIRNSFDIGEESWRIPEEE